MSPFFLAPLKESFYAPTFLMADQVWMNLRYGRKI